MRLTPLLKWVAKFSRIQEYFAPTNHNITAGTWRSAASLLQDRERIDFIQNTYEGKVSSFIIPQHKGMQDMFQIPIDDDLCWVYTGESDTQKDPYLGVLLQLSSTSSDDQAQSDSVPGIVPKVFVLYTKESIEQMQIESLSENFVSNQDSFALSVPFLDGFSLDIQGYLKTLTKARDFLLKEVEEKSFF